MICVWTYCRAMVKQLCGLGKGVGDELSSQGIENFLVLRLEYRNELRRRQGRFQPSIVSCRNGEST